MADTESESRRHRVRLTLRLRLTLLYGVVFVLAGAGLLTATYALFKHNQPEATTSFYGTVELRAPTPPAGFVNALRNAQSAVSHAGSGSPHARYTTTPSGGSGGAVPQSTIHRPASKTLGQLLRNVQHSDQTQVNAFVQGARRRADVVLHQQRTGDASALLDWSAIALGAVALLSIGLAWWLAGRALRPLRTMNARAREISAESLHQRLGGEDRGDELGELATTFDALLARLEAAFESQRRFVANASHELRTPITLERTLVEVALADPDASIESLRSVCERVVSSTEEQERLLDALLTLARSEAGTGAGESIDLALLVEDALLTREQRLGGISVARSLEPAVVVGDGALLERLVGNLVENAIVHNAGAEPWLSVATFASDEDAGLRIANSGEMVASADIDELFEPFRRGLGERIGNDAGGLGLGLSIVRAVALAHGARIETCPLPEGGLEFELRFTATAGGESAGAVAAATA